jgi:hypothetical protein
VSKFLSDSCGEAPFVFTVGFGLIASAVGLSRFENEENFFFFRFFFGRSGVFVLLLVKEPSCPASPSQPETS